MKKVLLLLSIVLSTIFGMAQIPTNGLVGYWNFNNNLNDLSGNNNNGTTNGCVFSTDRFGNSNSCVEFDGVDDVITVPHSASIDFDSYTESYTISFWFKSNDPLISSASTARFIEKWNGIASVNYPCNIIIYSNSIMSIFYDGSETSQTTVYGLFNNKWHNYTLVNNITTDSVYVYIDSTLTEQTVNNTSCSTNNQNDLLFGNTIGLIRPYCGLMDDIRFYDRVLDQSEITEIATETVTEINTLDTENLKNIYLNPTSRVITINIMDIQRIEIIDINGKVVYQTNVNKQNIDISNQNKGVYFVKVITAKGIETKKILIE